MGAVVLRWEAPPADGRGLVGDRKRSPRRDYAGMARALRERPGDWALVAEYPDRNGAVVAHRMRQGAAAGFKPAGAFEAESRNHGDGTQVWARYVGSGVS